MLSIFDPHKHELQTRGFMVSTRSSKHRTLLSLFESKYCRYLQSLIISTCHKISPRFARVARHHERSVLDVFAACDYGADLLHLEKRWVSHIYEKIMKIRNVVLSDRDSSRSSAARIPQSLCVFLSVDLGIHIWVELSSESLEDGSMYSCHTTSCLLGSFLHRSSTFLSSCSADLIGTGCL